MERPLASYIQYLLSVDNFLHAHLFMSFQYPRVENFEFFSNHAVSRVVILAFLSENFKISTPGLTGCCNSSGAIGGKEVEPPIVAVTFI